MKSLQQWQQLVNLQDEAYRCLKRFRIEYLMDGQNKNSRLLRNIEKKMSNRFYRRADLVNNFEMNL